MCYFLYHFRIGKEKDVNACVEACKEEYRIAHQPCDCESSIGEKDPQKADLKELEELFVQLKTVRGIKYVWLSKNWWKNTNLKQEAVHVDDINVPHFLANAEEN